MNNVVTSNHSLFEHPTIDYFNTKLFCIFERGFLKEITKFLKKYLKKFKITK